MKIFPSIDFNNHRTKVDKKPSHLHQMKPVPDPQGNRAERRAAEKRRRKA